MKLPYGRLLSSVSCVLMTLGCSQLDTRNVDWAYNGNTGDEQRFSELTQIAPNTIKRLGLAWSLDLPGEIALEATPLEVAGKLYFPGGLGKVYAVDAVSGKIDWTYDAADVEHDSTAAERLYGVNRGVAFREGVVFYASRDGRMIAIDAKTGKAIWETKFLEAKWNSSSSGAPRVIGDKIIIGNSGADFGGRGVVSALDAKTGKIAWRFYIVPGNPADGFEDESTARAAKTWAGEWWKNGGGGTDWNAFTYDPEFNQVLIGTGNGGPWNCHDRAPTPDKVNLYLASVVAVDAKTGKYKWHYQYNPRECWDWKATSDMILAKLKIDGEDRKVVMQQPSNGFFYVIDRSNGKLLSADKYAKANWADRIDLKTGLPVEINNLRYEKGPVTIYPGQQGAHNWQPSAYNPQTGLVYIPTTQTGAIFNATPQARKDLDFDRGKVRLRAAVEVSLPKSNDPLDYKGGLIAWDPIKKKIAWRVSYPYLFIGGAMTTKSNLVFQGTVDGNLYAYDGVSGKRLWSFNVGHAILAAPITYSVNGRQYVSVLAGVGGSASEGGYPSGSTPVWKYGLPRRLLTFALDAKGKLPAPVELPDTPPLDDPKLVLDPARVARGDHLYNYTCGACHGGGLISMGGGPDLRGSSVALDRSTFRQVVMDGAMVAGGMPKWDITDDQLEDIYQYIRAGARMEILERKGRPADASVAGLSKKRKTAHR